MDILLAGVAVLAVAPAASADTRSFANSSPIAVPFAGTQGVGSLYPSSVSVTGMTGAVTSVNVTVHDVSHTFPADLDMLLVSPRGSRVILMSGVCREPAVIDFTWIFDQARGPAMPLEGPCEELVYRPSFNAVPGPWPAPAPAGPHEGTLDAFDNEQANGTWSLYVADGNEDDTGNIARGWTLTVTTAPVDVSIPLTGSSGVASQYPSTRALGPPGRILTDVNVAVAGIWHQRPDDLDLLLVGPQGQKVVLMSDACGTFEVAAFGWTWDDEAAGVMPDGDATNQCGTPRHRPTDHAPAETWPAPAPPGPYGTSLSAFDLTDPAGEWRLFIHDDLGGAVGFFTTRFAVGTTTREPASVAFTESQVAVEEGATRTLTLRRSATSAELGAGAINVTTLPGSATSGTDFAPVTTTVGFPPGQTERTVSVSALADGAAELDETFVVTLGASTGDAAAGTPSSVAVTIPAPPAPPGPAPDAAPLPLAPLCAGRRATIVGTARRDVLRGTRRADVIVALGGNDVVRAGLGNDLVCAGPGNDTVAGNAGADHVRGGPGNDQIRGGTGADRLLGETGIDRLMGEAGVDRLFGGPGRDTCVGGAGRDQAACERRQGI